MDVCEDERKGQQQYNGKGFEGFYPRFSYLLKLFFLHIILVKFTCLHSQQCIHFLSHLSDLICFPNDKHFKYTGPLL